MDIQTIVAAAIFVAAIILLIIMMKKKLLHGGSCCGGHEAPESKVKVADKNISHYDYHYEVSIEGMVCSNCATRVENALNGNEGIYAKADLGNKKAVIHAKRALSKEEVLGYVKELPYTIMSFAQK
ncbi:MULTISPECIES: heavy-metal-associated domain-containing protein [unclassified Butyrivibrio]|jgi:copper chaperone CopZ|uniref:heavy-metal-associated domain-containing protein n=1 Tax=unclassified Butyrivibrio TaxID=2639466 RepID=UPI0003B64735|nr:MULTISPECIES: heavy metal-associated domain-containing protein [unclassified Butyrivibrio]